MIKSILARVAILLLIASMFSGCILIPVDDGYHGGDSRGGHHGEHHEHGDDHGGHR